MIRQIWKFRNTEDDPAEKTPLATEESSAAQVTEDDESQRKDVTNSQDKPPQPGEGLRAEAQVHKKEKRSALLSKASQAALSVCTYDPHSATLYALVEQPAPGEVATGEESPAQNEEENK